MSLAIDYLYGTKLMTRGIVLVVDDDDGVQTLMGVLLKRKEFEVELAHDGQEALNKMRQTQYAAILLDLMMPRLSGYEVLDRLAKMSPSERPMVIVLTAGTSTLELDAGCVTGMVRKPFDIELLLDAITACLSTCGERPQLDTCPAPESEAMPAPKVPGQPN